jgi:ribosomal protein S18 acetylase RimI-like enzyme
MVRADNRVAQTLYRNLGFETVDGYAYLVRG